LTSLVKGDLDQNGKVNFFDFRVIARAVTGTGAVLSFGGSGVPEPASGVLLLVGLVAAAVVRRSRCPTR
jgi:PEP-CTERM motif